MTIKDKAVAQLLKPPAIEYVRSLESLTKEHPNYVDANKVDVGNMIHGFLAGSGFHWDREIFEKEWPSILQEAIARLGSK